MILVLGALVLSGCTKYQQEEYEPSLRVNNQEVICDYNTYNCEDLKTQSFARTVMIHCMEQRMGDIHHLDGDSDGVPCEHLPPY